MCSLFSSRFTRLSDSPCFYLAAVLLIVIVMSSVLQAQNPAPATPTPSAEAPSQPAGDQSATIRGVVLSTVDKKPIPGVLVTLMNSHRSVSSDDKGQFAFSRVPVGSEFVAAKKPGFLCSLMRSRQQPKCFENVDVQPGDIQVTLTMVPQAAITGRIVDQSGKPVKNLHLNLMHRENVDGHITWQVMGQSHTKTNDEGVFRMDGLESGSYLLQTLNTVDPQEGREDADHGYAATYFPGTTNLSDAKPIVVQAGEEFKADLTVTHEKFQLVTVTPAWDHPWKPGNPGWCLSGFGNQDYLSSMWDDTHLRLYAPAGDYKIGFTIYPPTDPKNGELLPWPDGTKLPYIGSVEFTVKDQPLALTGIPSRQAATVPLHVRAELTQQEKRKAAIPQYDVYSPPGATFAPLNGQDRFGWVNWRSDQGPSDFEFKDIPPGRYEIQGSSYQYSYVASLTCGGINLLREPLVIGPGIPACSIEALIRDDFSFLSVGFTAQAKAQLTAAGITVTDFALIPAENGLDLPYSALIWLATEPKKEAIPPGTYLAFLFDGRPIAWRDPDERKRLVSLGTMVTLAPGQSKTVLLDWRPELNDQHTQPAGVALGRVLP